MQLLTNLYALEATCLNLINDDRPVGFRLFYSGDYDDSSPACGTYACLGGYYVFDQIARGRFQRFTEGDLCRYRDFFPLGDNLAGELFGIGHSKKTEEPTSPDYSRAAVVTELRKRLAVVREIIAFIEACEAGEFSAEVKAA